MHPSDPLVAYVVSGYDAETDHLRYDLTVSHLDGEVVLTRRDARAPRWSPNGSHLAYSAQDGGRWMLAVTDLEGDQWDLDLPDGDLTQHCWSPDGDRLAVVTTESSLKPARSTPFQAYSSSDWLVPTLMSASIVGPGRDSTPVAPDLDEVRLVDWSPDGDRIAVVSSHGVDRDESLADGIWVWSSATGETSQICAPTAPIHSLTWSPEEDSVAYLTSAKDNSNSAPLELRVIHLDSSQVQTLGVSLDRSLGKAVRGDDERGLGTPILEWAEDSGSVLAVYAEGGDSRLASFDLAGSHASVEIADSCVLEFSSSVVGLVYSWSDATSPGDLSWFDRQTGQSRRLTDVNAQLLTDVDLLKTVDVSVVASDGVSVEGFLTLPDDPDDAPLVVQVHGGPHYAVGNRFSFDSQRLAARGCAVLRSNPRGAHGYGSTFASGNLGDWGGRDFMDLVELVDEVVATYGLDRENVIIVGESYGGYMAAWAASSSDRFSAAVVENGISDLLSSAAGSVGTTFWYDELGGAPWEIPSVYVDRSPISRADRIDIPVLILHCEEDQTSSIAQGEALYSALSLLGKDVRFWRIPEEGHFFNVFGALSRRMSRTTVLDDFILESTAEAVSSNHHNTEETA